MQLQFTKMHGLGNDFVVIDGINQDISLSSEQVRFIADRRFGVGCDQLLVVEQSSEGKADFYYRIFNADGSEVGQCGNGARCFMRFIHDKGLTQKEAVSVETSSGLMSLKRLDNERVQVNIGVPNFEPDKIPFQADAMANSYTLEVQGESVEIGAVSVGNPHAVILVEDVKKAPVERLGPVIEQHVRFPEHVNVGFMEIVNPGRIRLRVYERGAGETMACGSGACAAVAVGFSKGLLNEEVIVELPAGELIINWSGEGQPLWMTGSTVSVFEGTIDI